MRVAPKVDRRLWGLWRSTVSRRNFAKSARSILLILALREERQRVDVVGGADNEVQVRPRAPAGRADVTDDLAGGHALAFGHARGRDHVGVARREPAVVGERHVV